MKVTTDSVYMHIDNKKFYVVKGIGWHTENEEVTVRYEPLYPSEIKEFYRPLEGPKGFRNRFTK